MNVLWNAPLEIMQLLYMQQFFTKYIIYRLFRWSVLNASYIYIYTPIILKNIYFLLNRQKNKKYNYKTYNLY